MLHCVTFSCPCVNYFLFCREGCGIADMQACQRDSHVTPQCSLLSDTLWLPARELVVARRRMFEWCTTHYQSKGQQPVWTVEALPTHNLPHATRNPEEARHTKPRLCCVHPVMLNTKPGRAVTWIQGFLSAFAKLRKATSNSVFSPLARMEQLGSHWKDVHDILYLSFSRKSVELRITSIPYTKKFPHLWQYSS